MEGDRESKGAYDDSDAEEAVRWFFANSARAVRAESSSSESLPNPDSPGLSCLTRLLSATDVRFFVNSIHSSSSSSREFTG